MSENEKIGQEEEDSFSGRRGFFFTVLGGAVAALTGWIAGAFPREVGPAQEDDPGASLAETRISALEARLAQLTDELGAIRGIQPLGGQFCVHGEVAGMGRVYPARLRVLSALRTARDG